MTRIWDNYEIEERTEYGSAAHRNRGRYSGQKIHRVYAEYIVGVVDEAKELARIDVHGRPIPTMGRRFLTNGRQPVLFAAHPACGCTNGQMAAHPHKGLTADNVTCEKCKR